MTTPHPTVTNPLTRAELLALGERLVAAWNGHDPGAVSALVTPDVRYLDPSLPAPVVGRSAFEESLRDTFTTFPDFTVDLAELEVFPDEATQTCVATWVITGTMTGPMQGLPGTGRTHRTAGATRCRVRDGLISDYVHHYDVLALMQQLGILPSADGLGFKAVVTAQVVGRVVAQRARKALHR